jgi:hypothetical protein
MHSMQWSKTKRRQVLILRQSADILDCVYVSVSSVDIPLVHYKFPSPNILSPDRASGWKAGMCGMSAVAGILQEWQLPGVTGLWSASTRGILTLDHSPPSIIACQRARR